MLVIIERLSPVTKGGIGRKGGYIVGHMGKTACRLRRVHAL